MFDDPDRVSNNRAGTNDTTSASLVNAALTSTIRSVDAVEKHDIGYIDVVAVNLYPFRETVASGADFASCVENIDIGGPAMIRAAAKNHPFVYVLVDSADYAPLIEHLKGDFSEEEDMKMRKKLAWKAYQHCASYDSVVAEYLWSEIGEGAPAPELSVPMTLMDTLRYGENPHQPAAVYADASLAERLRVPALRRPPCVSG